MQIREAILKAADHIERHPREFNYNSIHVPERAGCGTTGCALGWICYFFGSGVTDSSLVRTNFSSTHAPVGAGVSDGVFYARMTDLVVGWEKDADNCARALRLYADKYHPADTTIRQPLAKWQDCPWQPAREGVK
jgi:hypothetical protein